MSTAAHPLYDLLPAIHRIRDVAQGEPLAALLEVIAEQILLFEENLQQLYNDQFIETCADWVAPYIGDLIGYRPLYGVAPAISSPRAEVANTIRYRRRKGTASMLEQLTRDVTGWNVRAVEFFEWLGWNQYMQHTRVDPPRGGTLNLRSHDSCERVAHANGAFDTSAHSIDVRRVSTAGRYGIRNVGLFIWRLQAFPVKRSQARKLGDGRYTFHPAGVDAPLFNLPQPETEFTHLAEEINVPGPLRSRALYDDLELLRAAVAANESPQSAYFGARPVFNIFANDEADAVPLQEIVICNLQEWHEPPTNLNGQPIRLAVDPVLGRFTCHAADNVEVWQVNYQYGFADAMGGGPYDRTQSATLDRQATWQVGVSKSHSAIEDEMFATLTEAVAAWNAQPDGTCGVIAILDSARYDENLTGDDKIQIPAGSRLLIIAADWPEHKASAAAVATGRVRGELTADDLWPHVLGDVSVVGTAASDAENPGDLILNGLVLEGVLTVLIGNLGALTLDHSTLVPGSSELLVNAAAADIDKRNSQFALNIERSICGRVTLAEAEFKLQITDSIVTNGVENDAARTAIDAARANVEIVRSTICGASSVGMIEARNSIFTGPVTAARRQSGCIGFSYIPLESRAPRRFRCQPDFEISTQIARGEKQVPLAQSERDLLRSSIAGWMKPTFTSTRYGQPGFGQLHSSSPIQLRAGADDEAEMGVFHNLFQPQRETNLRVRLDEYLRFGFEAGIVYVT